MPIYILKKDGMEREKQPNYLCKIESFIKKRLNTSSCKLVLQNLSDNT